MGVKKGRDKKLITFFARGNYMYIGYVGSFPANVSRWNNDRDIKYSQVREEAF